MIDPKELKKLADACRKAGIKHFKNADIEFTLTEEAPVSNYKRKKEVIMLPEGSLLQETIKNADTLTEDELLFWSTGSDEEESQPTN